MDGWVAQIDQWLKQDIQVYFFVHCPVERRSPTNARHFQSLLEAQEIGVPPLPWNNLEPPPAQLELF